MPPRGGLDVEGGKVVRPIRAMAVFSGSDCLTSGGAAQRGVNARGEKHRSATEKQWRATGFSSFRVR